MNDITNGGAGCSRLAALRILASVGSEVRVREGRRCVGPRHQQHRSVSRLLQAPLIGRVWVAIWVSQRLESLKSRVLHFELKHQTNHAGFCSRGKHWDLVYSNFKGSGLIQKKKYDALNYFSTGKIIVIIFYNSSVLHKLVTLVGLHKNLMSKLCKRDATTVEPNLTRYQSLTLWSQVQHRTVT